jgi:uncharacterized protein YggE
MINTVGKTIFGKIILFLIILILYFRFVGPIPLSVTQTTVEKKTTFNVEGTGKVSAVPDTAEVNLGIETSKKTVVEAQKEANEKINRIIDAVKKIGIEERYIKTVNYSVYPQYDFKEGRSVTGYNVNVSLQIKVKNFEKINTVIDSATSLGANQVGGLNFTIDDKKLEELKMQARKQAIEEAKKKAKEMAALAGIRLGKIVNISENSTSPYFPQSLKQMQMGMGGGDQETQTQIQPGESEITISITLSYETL